MSTPITFGWSEDELPELPENTDFNDLLTPEEQERYAERFERGIALGEARLREARLREERSKTLQHDRSIGAKARRASVMARRFNPVLRSRP